MPNGYKIRGIEPPDLKDYPPSVRKLYWSWVVELGIKAKIRDLSAGLDKDGKALKPIDEETRKHRKSEMTPSGKGSPDAPPLSPAYHKSRTQSLLSGRALSTHAEFFWRYDAWTGESWAEVLTYQIDQGRDVFGLSPKGTKWVKEYALKRWEAWKKAGKPSMPLATAPLSSNRAQPVPLPKFGSVGVDQFNAIFRGASPNAVPFRPAPRAIPHSTTGPGNNLLLGHVWGTAKGGAVSIPKPTPIVPTIPRVSPKAPTVIPPRMVATAVQRASMSPRKPTPPPVTTKVSDAFDLNGPDKHPVTGQFTRILNAIDSVLTLGTTKPSKVPVTKGLTIGDAQGAFLYRISTGAPVRIEIRESGPTRGFTLAHEIGHYIEVTQLDGHNQGNRDWDRDTLMRPFIEAVQNSIAFQRLASVQGKAKASENGNIYTIDPGHTDYLLANNELWARAFAQWVATRSKDGRLLEQLDYSRDMNRHPVYHAAQWGDQDFAEIANAIDGIFRKVGWLK